MRILFVNEYIYPNVVSGAEFSMQELALNLKKEREKIIFFGPNLSRKKIRKFKDIEIYNYYFPKKILPYKSLSPFWFNNPLFWLYSSFFLIQCCFKEKIEFIHVHGKYLLPSAIIAKLILKIPVVVTVRDYKFLCPLAICLFSQNKKCSFIYFLKKEIKKYFEIYEKNSNKFFRLVLSLRILMNKLIQEILFLLLKSADKVIGVSDALIKIYQNSGITREKLIRIYNIPPNVTQFLNKKKDKSVLSVGKLSYGKGSDILFKAMEKVIKKNPEAKLILVGRKSFSIDRLPSFAIHYENIPNEKIGDFYRKASVFILLSRWSEPLSRSSLEALSFGLPLVLSKKGGNNEIVKNEINGYLVDLNADEVAKKILLILQNRKLRDNFGRESLKILKNRFNSQNIVKQHLALYRSLSK